MMEKFKKIISIIILVIALPILFVNVVILADSALHPEEVPSFFGYKPFIVLSGSMRNVINDGDLVLSKECDTESLKVGDIISFKEDEVVVTHRIIDIVSENGEKHFITKGDNNDTQDSGFVLADNIEGIFLFKVSGLGNVAMFLQTPIGMIVALSIPLAILICINISNSKDSNDDESEKMKKEIERLKKENAKLKK